MKPSEKLVELVNRLPGPGKNSNLSDAEAGAVEKVIAEVHKGGSENVAGLVAMLVEPSKGDDSRARYGLHALAVHVCKLKDDTARRAFAAALASTLDGDHAKAVKAFVVRQLQVAGGKEVAPALGKLLLDEEVGDDAAQALLAIKAGAAEQFRRALPNAKGKARLTVVLALGVLGDGASVDALKQAAGDKDRDTRLAALWALANVGDAGSVDLLIKASDAKETYDRIRATKACLVLAEKLSAAGKKTEAARIYTHLKETRTDPSEQYVRDAALAGTGK